MAAGSYGDLAVVLSDENLRAAVQPALDRLNQPVTFVIKEETPFNIDVFGPGKWELCRGYKNILFIVRWGDGTVVEKRIAGLLSPKNLARFQSGSGALVKLQDPFARYQFAIVVGASDRNTLASLLRGSVEQIGELIEQECSLRIQRRSRREGVREDLLASYWQRYRFLLEIPLTYRENQVEPAGFPGIEWIANGPTRGITLAWRSTDDPQGFLRDREALLDWRREIGLALHNEDLQDQTLQWNEETLGKLEAVKLTGAWASTKIAGGGPFRCFFLADPPAGRVFCLDLLVFAPGLAKMPFFREMQAVAGTFALELPHP